jgi:acylphosphatase
MSARMIRRLVVRGRVQGVGYRAFVEDEAAALGLEGWVRNRRDGAVEALISGPQAAVEAMIGACRRGPYSAHVQGLDVMEATPELLQQSLPGERFSVLPTI